MNIVLEDVYDEVIKLENEYDEYENNKRKILNTKLKNDAKVLKKSSALRKYENELIKKTASV